MIRAFDLSPSVGGVEALTSDEIREKLREAVIEAAVAILVEAALLRFADRLKGQHRPSHRRFLRRAFGAVISELVAEGFAVSYAQRRRARAAFEWRLAREQESGRTLTLPPVPAQRTPTEDHVVVTAHAATS
jgi:hypothetical protein